MSCVQGIAAGVTALVLDTEAQMPKVYCVRQGTYNRTCFEAKSIDSTVPSYTARQRCLGALPDPSNQLQKRHLHPTERDPIKRHRSHRTVHSKVAGCNTFPTTPHSNPLHSHSDRPTTLPQPINTPLECHYLRLKEFSRPSPRVIKPFLQPSRPPSPRLALGLDGPQRCQ